jgi:hypothetical protein
MNILHIKDEMHFQACLGFVWTEELKDACEITLYFKLPSNTLST